MNLDNLFNEVIEEANIPALRTTQAAPIVDAIKKKNKITFYYSGPRKPKKLSVKPGYRIKAEPVAIGLNKNGYLVVRAYIDSPSQSKRGTPSNVGKEKANYGWRTFRVSRMSAVQLLKKETFDPTVREKYNGGQDDKSMTITYVKIKPGKGLEEPEITKPEAPKPEPAPISKPQPKPVPEPEEPEVGTQPTTTAAPTVKAKPVKTVDLNKAATQKITKKTRAFDQEISTAQNDLSNVQKQLDANRENLIKTKGTPDYQKYVDIARELTTQKDNLTKKVDDLVDQLAQAGVNQDKVAAQKFQSANSYKQNTGLKEIPKKQTPAENPGEEDEEMFVNESVINRIKKLINKMEYL
jgi:hypothetical protein